MRTSTRIATVGLSALASLAPFPGLTLLMNKKVRRTVRRAAGIALVGAGVLVTVPVALYVICKTSGDSTGKN